MARTAGLCWPHRWPPRGCPFQTSGRRRHVQGKSSCSKFLANSMHQGMLEMQPSIYSVLWYDIRGCRVCYITTCITKQLTRIFPATFSILGGRNLIQANLTWTSVKMTGMHATMPGRVWTWLGVALSNFARSFQYNASVRYSSQRWRFHLDAPWK